MSRRTRDTNPNRLSYWASRGYSRRPANWRELIDSDEYDSDDNATSDTGRNSYVGAYTRTNDYGFGDRSLATNNTALAATAALRSAGISSDQRTTSIMGNPEQWITAGVAITGAAYCITKLIVDACNEPPKTKK